MITPHRKQHTPSLIHVEILIRVSKRVPSMSQVRYCLRRSLSRLYQHSRSMIGASQIDIIGKHNVIIMQVLPLHTSIASVQMLQKITTQCNKQHSRGCDNQYVDVFFRIIRYSKSRSST